MQLSDIYYITTHCKVGLLFIHATYKQIVFHTLHCRYYKYAMKYYYMEEKFKMALKLWQISAKKPIWRTILDLGNSKIQKILYGLNHNMYMLELGCYFSKPQQSRF